MILIIGWPLARWLFQIISPQTQCPSRNATSLTTLTNKYFCPEINLFLTNIRPLRTVSSLTESDKSTFSKTLNSMACRSLVHCGLGARSESATSIRQIKYCNFAFILMLTTLMGKVLRSPTKMELNMILQCWVSIQRPLIITKTPNFPSFSLITEVLSILLRK